MVNRADLQVEQQPATKIPERALVNAVLCRALLDTGMFGGESAKPRDRRLAIEYVFSNDEYDFSFVVCARFRFDTITQAERFVRKCRKELSLYLTTGKIQPNNPKRNPGSNVR